MFDKPIWIGYMDGHCAAADGLRVMIFANDHLPAHVHVFGDGEAKIDLSEPAVVWADGMARAELRRAFKVVLDNRLRLLARWKVIHG